MKLKWSNAQSKYLSKKIPVATKNNDWIIWCILIVISLSGLMYLLVK